ncbi:MAG: hypothetical protein ACHQUB_02585 [Candidatus Saccharimonadia bacterium]
MKYKLPDSLYTPQSIHQVLAELVAQRVWMQHEQIKTQVIGSSGELSTTPVVSKWTSELIKVNNLSTPEAIDEISAELTTLLDKAPRIHFTFAAPPLELTKIRFVDWVRTELHPNALVEFDFYSGILGGVVVRTGSHTLDWSFRMQLLAARGRFAEVLRNV